MSEERNRLQELLRQLETERDELRVKLELAKMDAKDELQEMDHKLETLRGRMKVLADEAKEASEDVGAAAGVLADEIKEGFARLRKMV